MYVALKRKPTEGGELGNWWIGRLVNWGTGELGGRWIVETGELGEWWIGWVVESGGLEAIDCGRLRIYWLTLKLSFSSVPNMADMVLQNEINAWAIANSSPVYVIDSTEAPNCRKHRGTLSNPNHMIPENRHVLPIPVIIPVPRNIHANIANSTNKATVELAK